MKKIEKGLLNTKVRKVVRDNLIFNTMGGKNYPRFGKTERQDKGDSLCYLSLTVKSSLMDLQEKMSHTHWSLGLLLEEMVQGPGR